MRLVRRNRAKWLVCRVKSQPSYAIHMCWIVQISDFLSIHSKMLLCFAQSPKLFSPCPQNMDNLVCENTCNVQGNVYNKKNFRIKSSDFLQFWLNDLRTLLVYMLCLGHALIHPGVAGIVHQNVHLRNRNEYYGFILPYQIVCILYGVTSFCQAGYCEIHGSAVLLIGILSRYPYKLPIVLLRLDMW